MILGDWGTTTLRLWHGGERREGPGIGSGREPAEVFAELTEGWSGPALLCGTVGANIGWVDAGYSEAPATLEDVCALAVSPVEGVTILPGVATSSNVFGQPDVMRSEEVQAWGWAELNESTARLCLPGSHTKWVEMEGGRITNLTTGFVGELFKVVRSGTILVGQSEGSVAVGSEFRRGVELGAGHPHTLSAMFAVRAEAARNRITNEAARDRLSGVLVGADCAAMVRAWGGAPDAVVGSGAIAESYRVALGVLGHDVPLSDGEACALAGLRLASQVLGGTLGLADA